MQKFVESDLEQAALEWFEELGYEIVFGPDIAPDGEFAERKRFDEVILKERLIESMEKINPSLSQESIEEAFRKITLLSNPSLLSLNKSFYHWLVHGVDVSVRQLDGSFKTEKAYLFDFEKPLNNQFMVANQFSVEEHGVTKRPDLVVFINGLPIAVLELKSASHETVDLSHAYRQLETYKKTIPCLFTTNAFLVISDGINAKAGTLSSNEERFMMWRTIDGDDVASTQIPQLEVLIKGMFPYQRILDILKNFVFISIGRQ